MAQQLHLVPQDAIRKHEIFSGKDEDWIGWSFSLEAELSEYGWKDVLEAARQQPVPIAFHTMAVEVQEVTRNLYSLLAQRTRGKAQTIARLCQLEARSQRT